MDVDTLLELRDNLRQVQELLRKTAAQLPRRHFGLPDPRADRLFEIAHSVGTEAAGLEADAIDAAGRAALEGRL